MAQLTSNFVSKNLKMMRYYNILSETLVSVSATNLSSDIGYRDQLPMEYNVIVIHLLILT